MRAGRSGPGVRSPRWRDAPRGRAGSPLHRERVVGRLESHEEPVARGHHLLASVRGEERPQRLVVPGQQRLPRIVAHRFEQRRRSDDVGEHERLDALGRRAAAELPREQLRDLLEHDRLGRAREGGLAELLLVDAGRVHDASLPEVALVPVERRRGDRDAVARADAARSVDPRAEHLEHPRLERERGGVRA